MPASSIGETISNFRVCQCVTALQNQEQSQSKGAGNSTRATQDFRYPLPWTFSGFTL
jgi:hypothetical protein